MAAEGLDDKSGWRLSRRRFAWGLAALPATYAAAGRRVGGHGDASPAGADGAATTATREGRVQRVTLTSVEGLKVGHHTRSDRPTGCTVVLAETGATAGVAVRGPAPGTRETALLASENTVSAVHAVLLAGGSAFGLAAADGVMRHLRERGIGFGMGETVVPIVPAAILFDLGLGGTSYPDADDGAAACAAASTNPPAEGNAGAGAGATVGKTFGRRYAMKGGIGTAGHALADGTVVAALVAVNCGGDVRDPRSGRLVAGSRSEAGDSLRDAEAALLAGGELEAEAGEVPANTTIGVVATNRELTKAECNQLASVTHDGLARAIVPAHLPFDGDTLFFLATGAAGRPPERGGRIRLEVAAAAAVGEAIVRAVVAATGLPDLPSARDLGTA